MSADGLDDFPLYGTLGAIRGNGSASWPQTTEQTLLLQDGTAFTKSLHPTVWRLLLERAGTRHIFVREDQRGSSQHFGHGVLMEVKNDETLVIKPDSGHKKTESVPLATTHIWWSKTVDNKMGGFPEAELKSIIEEGLRMIMESESGGEVELKRTDIVLMDFGDLTFYGGQPQQGKYSFVEKVTGAFRYKQTGRAARTATLLHRNETATSKISEAGLTVVTVEQAWAVLRAGREIKQREGELPKVRRLNEVDKPNPRVIPELYAAFDPTPAPRGFATNLPAPDPSVPRARRQLQGHLPSTNGHHESHNGNGHISRITPFLPDNGIDLPGHNGQVPQALPQIDPSIYNAATVPLALMEIEKEADQAWKDMQEAQLMMNEALARYHAAQQKRGLMMLQIQPQIMAQAVKAEAMAMMQQGQKQLIQMLTDVGSGKMPVIEEKATPPALGESERQKSGDMVPVVAVGD